MTQYKPNKKKNRLLTVALVASTVASVFFGVKYYNARQALGQAQVEVQNTPMEDRVKDLYSSVAEKSSRIIPAVRSDYKRIAAYGGTGVLTGLFIAYLAKRKR